MTTSSSPEELKCEITSYWTDFQGDITSATDDEEEAEGEDDKLEGAVGERRRKSFIKEDLLLLLSVSDIDLDGVEGLSVVLVSGVTLCIPLDNLSRNSSSSTLVIHVSLLGWNNLLADALTAGVRTSVLSLVWGGSSLRMRCCKHVLPLPGGPCIDMQVISSLIF